MFFSNKDAEEVEYSEDAPNKNKLEGKYPKLKQLYFSDIDGTKLILNLSNKLKESHAIIQFEDGAIYRASYIGDVLFFMNSVIQQIGQNLALAGVMQKWLEGELPINNHPHIEIGPNIIVGYALETVKKYPSNLFAEYVEPMEHFAQELRKTEFLDLFHKL